MGGFIVLILSLSVAGAAYAFDVPSNNSQIISFLNKFSSILHPVNYMYYSLRQFGWALITTLGFFIDQLSKGFTQLATMDPFFNSPAAIAVFNSMKPFRGPIMGSVLVGIGLFMIMGFRLKGGEILRNFTVMILIVLALPFLMDKMWIMASAYLKDGAHMDQVGSQVILSNVSDLYYYAKDDFKTTKPSKTLGATDVSQIDITEIADPDTVKDLANKKGKYIDYKIESVVNSNGSIKQVAVQKGGIQSFFKMFASITGDYYYRYTWHPWIMLFTLGANGLVLFLAMFKLGGLGFDLMFNKIFLLVVSFFDFSMSKFRRLMENIFASIGAVMAISCIMTLFTLYSAFLNSAHIGAIPRTIALLAGAYAAINGPDSVVRVLGVDAGVKSGWQLIGGALGVKKAAEMGGKFLKKGGNMLSAVAGAVAGASGFGQKKSQTSGDGLLHGKNGLMNDTSNSSVDPSASIEGDTASPVYGDTSGGDQRGRNANQPEKGNNTNERPESPLNNNESSKNEKTDTANQEQGKSVNDADMGKGDLGQSGATSEKKPFDDNKNHDGKPNSPISGNTTDQSNGKKPNSGQSTPLNSSEKKEGSPVYADQKKGNTSANKKVSPNGAGKTNESPINGSQKNGNDSTQPKQPTDQKVQSPVSGTAKSENNQGESTGSTKPSSANTGESVSSPISSGEPSLSDGGAESFGNEVAASMSDTGSSSPEGMIHTTTASPIGEPDTSGSGVIEGASTGNDSSAKQGSAFDLPSTHQDPNHTHGAGGKENTSDNRLNINPMEFEPGQARSAFKHPVRDVMKKYVKNKVQNSSVSKNFNKGSEFGKKVKEARDFNDAVRKGEKK
ncbi:MAG: hypothetical protein K0Q87_157 [Neobacillus sp.]|jgi:hypothetical protein|nr:hypothetical protein [Neobacillus sp.]